MVAVRLPKRLQALNIKDVNHLAYLLGTTKSELESITDGIRTNPHKYYRRRFIVRNGKRRPIATPRGRFRQVTDRLNCLLQRLIFPDNMHGGLTGHSTRGYAKPHTNKPVIVKADIKDFFPNIRPGRVYDAFCNLGCSPDVSRYLTRLTTLEGKIPQGSPTSTVVANILSAKLARRLQGLADSIGGDVSTFVDDIALSGPHFARNLEPTVRRIMRQEGYQVNESKTLVLDCAKEQVLTGIRVNHGLDAPSAKIREVRDLIADLEKRLLSGKEVAPSEMASLGGKIRHLSTLNKGAAKSLSRRLRRVLARAKTHGLDTA